MLNRLYIVIGVLAIVVLGAGFVVPRWIDWGGYRDRLESLARASLGAEVVIGGEIDFTLLPQPRMRFGKTTIGPPDAPFLQIDTIVADFSLMDFLRDRFTVTKLVLQAPALSLRVNEDGGFEIPFSFPPTLAASNISVAVAQINAGELGLSDARTGKSWKIENFEGSLRISDVRGPFGLAGDGQYDGQTVGVRVNTSAMNEAGEMQVSLFLRPQNAAYSFSGEGLFTAGSFPTFKGEIAYRSKPSASDTAQQVKGDFVVTSEAEFSAEKLLLSAFSIQPDENRAGTRLSGAAVVRLGREPDFDAVISSGVLALAPLDLTESQQETPYALVHLLNELPAPFVPPIPGRIGVDIAELDLRGFSLRNVRIDATSDAKSWKLEDFTGTLPGNTVLTLSGELPGPGQGLGQGPGQGLGQGLGYEGTLEVKTSRLDALVRLWRRSDETNPLFNIDASLRADISLSDGELEIANARFSLGQQVHEFAGRLQLSGERNALVSARLKAMNAAQTRALMAVLPDFSRDQGFNVTFPTGSLDVVAERAVLFDLAGKNLSLQMDWGPEGVNIARASAGDLGGARLSLSANLSGSMSAPAVSGQGSVSLSPEARDGFLPAFLNRAGAEEILTNWLARSLPVDATFTLEPPGENRTQQLSVQGKAGVADFQLSAQLGDGIINLARAPLSVTADIQSSQPDELTGQLGLGTTTLLEPDEPVSITMTGQGTLVNSLETTIVAQAGTDRLGFAGLLVLSDLSALSGRALVDFALSDPAPMLKLAGMEGLHIGAVEGTANVSFTGRQSVSVQNLVANSMDSDGAAVAGQFVLAQSGERKLVTGQLDVGELDAARLLVLLAGPGALVSGDGFWPEGPIDLGPSLRPSRGRIDVTSPAITVFGRKLITDAGFQFTWDGSGVALDNIVGTNADGSVSGSVELCCSALEGEKQLSGRLTLSGVEVKNLLPDALSAFLAGTIEAGVRVEATGSSVAGFMQTLGGEGSFTLSGLEVAKFDPEAFATLAGMENIAQLDADALSSVLSLALDQGSFKAPSLSGIFRLAGGMARLDNLAAEGDGARLLGDLGVDFSDLSISGKWTMTPTQMDDHIGLVNQSTARVSAILGGSLTSPERELELGSMIDAIQVRALEIELDRLETLRAEEEARSAAAAAQRARLMELEAERKAQEAARLAAEAEAHRLEKEAERLAAEGGDPLVVDPGAQDPAVSDPDVTDLLTGQ